MMKKSSVKKISIEAVLLSGFILALVVVLIVSILAYEDVSLSIYTNQRVSHTQEVLKNLGNLHADLWKLASADHGYAILGDKAYYEQYRSTIPLIDDQFQQLRKLTLDNVKQQQYLNALQPLLSQFLNFAQQIIESTNKQGLIATRQLLASNQGLNLIESSVRIIKEMEMYENQLLQQRIAIAHNKDRQVYLSIFAAFILQLIILSVLYVMLRRNLYQRKQVEKDLLESQERYLAVTRATSDVIWDRNLLTDNMWFNENAKKVFHYSAHRIGNNFAWWLNHIHEEDRSHVQKALMAVIKGDQQTWSAEYRFRREEGGYVDLFDRGYVIRDENGIPIRMVGSIVDVTERNRVEKMKNEFVSTVSHELRTPLTSIRGSLGLVIGNAAGQLPEKAQKLLEIAYHNCERLIRLINDILDIEKIKAGKMVFVMKPIVINAIVKEAIIANQAYADKFGVTLVYVEPAETFVVKADYDRLMQILANLISNAAKFSPQGGKVTIIIAQQDKKVRVSVIDQGKGITEDFQEKIFQKFAQADSSSTRSSGGTGLGLSISRAIIEKMGGMLSFASRVNQGTRFYFDLPLYEEAFKTEQTLLGKSLKKSRASILVCEDDEEAAKLLRVFLEENEFTVDIARTAAEAKNLLAKNVYVAMTLDLLLPDQNGIALIKEIRRNKNTYNLPIIVISGKAQEGRKKLNGDAFAVVDWLNKPIDKNQLMVAMRQVKSNMLSSNPYILHVEDDEDILRVVAAILQDNAQLTSAMSLHEAKQKLATQEFDLVILDLKLPDGSGAELLPLLAERIIPVVVFSAHELEQEYANYVSKILIKSQTSNQELLNTMKTIIQSHNI